MPIKVIKLIRVVGLLVVAAAFASVWVRSPEAAASSRYQAGPNRAALVVRFSDDDVYTHCISFSEAQIDAEDLLLRANLSVEIGDDNAICRINSTGCPALGNCACAWNTSPPTYWAHYLWENNQWQYYNHLAPVQIPVVNGSLVGFSWGPGDQTSAVEPPVYTYDQICVSSIPPTATPTATAAWPLAQSTAPVAAPIDQPGALPLPQVTFTADSTSIAWGACTVVRWVAWDAAEVTVNGTPVTGQEWLEVCPEVTERYVLVAANSTGQAAQEVQVEVIGTDLQPQPGAALPVSTPAQFGVPGAAAIPGATPIPQPMVALAASPTGSPAPTVYFAFAPTATLTPRPRRILGADGGPTPTPLLVARAGLPAQEAPTTGTTTGAPPLLPVVDRAFSVALLPGYAAYLILAASLAGACVWVIRRKASTSPER